MSADPGRKEDASSADEKVCLLSSSRNLSLSTMVSRILGFFREILTAGVIGGGALMSAWVLASTFANICRRVLGEGELGKALVPVITYTIEREGTVRARQKFATLLIYLSLLLAVISIVIAGISLCLLPYAETERWRLAFRITPLIMPYTVFICLVGIMSSYANSLREYFLPSLAAIVQNVILIVALACFCIRLNGADKLYALCVAILISGVLECLLLIWVVRRTGMPPVFSAGVWRDREALREIFKLALPGIVGASALQISLLVDRGIAGYLGDYAAPALYNSDRLIYLPIGIFAISFATVANTEMSRAAAAGDMGKLLESLFFTMKILLFITIPMAAFFVCFGNELISFFFFRGQFDLAAVKETVYALTFYAFGIPSFAVYKLTVAGFMARKDMITPLIVSVSCVVLNVILNLILMWHLRQGGIALATVITSYLNNIILLYLLKRQLKIEKKEFTSIGIFFGQILLISIAASLCAYLIACGVEPFCGRIFSGAAGTVRSALQNILYYGIILACGGAMFGIVLIGLAFLLKIEEIRVFIRRFLHIKL